MSKIFPLLVFLTLNFCSARSQQFFFAELIVNRLSQAYNDRQYPAIYQMLSPGFRATVSEQAITSFFSKSLRPSLGVMVKSKLTERNENTYSFRVEFENGLRSLILEADAANNINFMVFRPLQATDKIYSNNPLNSPLRIKADSIVRAFMSVSGNSAMAIALVTNGRTDTLYYGSPAAGAGKADGRTVFEIGSITKTFTGVALAAALKSGKIRLDDDIRKYLPNPYPNLNFRGKFITVRDLATHRSGLPRMPADFQSQPAYNAGNPYASYTREALLQYLGRVQPDTIPGAREEYSNLGIAVLGLVLESATATPLNTQLKTHVLKPLKMSHTDFVVTPAGDQLAAGYHTLSGKPANMWTMGVFDPAGGLKSTLPDMLRYLQANMSPQNDLLATAQRPIAGGGNRYSGLCWILSGVQERQIWHNGVTGGSSSFLGFYPGTKKGIVVLSNSNTPVDGLAQRLLQLLSN